MHISTETYEANLDDAWTHDGKPCIDIDTRGDDLDHPYFPNFGATTKVIVPVSDEYEPEVYRKALAESSAPRRSTAGLSDRPSRKDKRSVGTAGTKTPVARR